MIDNVCTRYELCYETPRDPENQDADARTLLRSVYEEKGHDEKLKEKGLKSALIIDSLYLTSQWLSNLGVDFNSILNLPKKLFIYHNLIIHQLLK